MVAEVLDLQPYSVRLCETHPLSRLRGTLSLIDRGQSDGGIGTCTPLEKEYGSGSWALPTAYTYLPGTETLPSGNHSVTRHECGDLAKTAARLVSGLSGPCANDMHDHGMLISFTHLLVTVLWRPLMSARTMPVSIMSRMCCRRLPWSKSSLPAKMSFFTPFSETTLW